MSQRATPFAVRYSREACVRDVVLGLETNPHHSQCSLGADDDEVLWGRFASAVGVLLGSRDAPPPPSR